MGGPCNLTRRLRHERCKSQVAESMSVSAWPSEWHMALLDSETEGERHRSHGLTANAAVGLLILGRLVRLRLSQWDSVLGQGSASGYDQLFKWFLWLSCPFSTMNARCKAPADALNVITDYSWLTNRQAGSAPINPAMFSPMPLQGDPGGDSTPAWVTGVNGGQDILMKGRVMVTCWKRLVDTKVLLSKHRRYACSNSSYF